MRPWLLLVVIVACDGERLAAKDNGRAAAVARELEAMRQLEVLMCRCPNLGCLGMMRSTIQAWWEGLADRLAHALDETELQTAEALGRSADVCFQRTLTQSFLRAAETHRRQLCDRREPLDPIIDEMRAYSDDFEKLPGKPWPRFAGDERERAYASLTHFAWCAEAVAPGVQSRLPAVFRTWVEPPTPKAGPTTIR